MLGGAVGGWFVAFILIAPALVIACVWAIVSRSDGRRFAWVLCGIAGLPAPAFGILYLIGLPVIALAFVLGAVFAMTRRLDHIASAAYVGGDLALGIVTAMRDVTGWEWVGIMLFLASVLAALLSVTKLGQMTVRYIWGERPSTDDGEPSLERMPGIS